MGAGGGCRGVKGRVPWGVDNTIDPLDVDDMEKGDGPDDGSDTLCISPLVVTPSADPKIWSPWPPRKARDPCGGSRGPSSGVACCPSCISCSCPFSSVAAPR